MTAPAPPPPPGGPGQTITVTPDNVLQARRIIRDAVDDARARLAAAKWKLPVQPPANDEISTTAAAMWNKHLLARPDSHYNRLTQYIDSVEALAKQLEDTARQYGFTEEEIAASFRSTGAQQR